MSQVYRSNPELVHIADGQRAELGRDVADFLNLSVRAQARSKDPGQWTKPLCPGCYMVAIFNCAIELARANGQSVTELGRSLGAAFNQLAQDGDYKESIESIEVQLDACEVSQS